jgi:hypothetical protein
MSHINSNDDLAAAIAKLPREVRAGLATLSREEQAAYLASLDRMADMETKGETFLPQMADPEAPYGRRRDGTPKARPGRKPAPNPGARTKERPERTQTSQIDLEALLAELPDGDEPIPVPADYPRPGAAPEVTELAPQVPTAADDREAAEREAYELELAEALEKAGRTSTGREIVSREFTGQRRVEPEDPDDPLAIATVETRTYRVTADDQQYHLEQLMPVPGGIGSSWHTVRSCYDLTGLAFHFAFYRVVVDFAAAIQGVPRYRPDRQRYMDGMWKPEPAPATPEARAQRDSEIRAEMARQRRAGPSAPFVGSWM